MPLPTPGYFLGVPTNLYGPVPTPGVPSTLFVDLLNAQTVAGAKTFTDTTSFIRAAQAGSPEAVATFGTSDDPNGRFTISNATSGDNQFQPLFVFTSPNNSGIPAWLCLANGLIATGSAPVVDWRISAASAAPTTRDLFTIRRGGTERVWTMGAFGNVTSTVSSQAGVAEEFARFGTLDAFSFARIKNSSAADGLVNPEFGGLLASSSISAVTVFSSELTVDAASPTPAMLFHSRVSAAGALSNRIPFVWRNGNRDDMALTPAGSLQLRNAGAGLEYTNATNPRALNVTLVAGSVMVANPTVTAKTIIYHARKTAGGTTGEITYTVNPGVGYTINSSSALDTSTVSLQMVEGP